MGKRVADMTVEELERVREYRRERPIASATRARGYGALPFPPLGFNLSRQPHVKHAAMFATLHGEIHFLERVAI